jgi:hypothetical protein
VSQDGQTLLLRQVDWICESVVTFTYHRKAPP